MRPGGLIWPLLGVLAVVAARRWLDVVEVRGTSMSPALLPGDRLFVVRASPRVGDVVLARDPREPSRELIKRVAAVDAIGVRLRGDNLTASTDERTFGPVSSDSVRWRAVVRFWPPARIALVTPECRAMAGGGPIDAGSDRAGHRLRSGATNREVEPPMRSSVALRRKGMGGIGPDGRELRR
jgi:nickel-type superoxide dismutase maturation protease